MSDMYQSDVDDEADETPDFEQRTFEVFNPDGSVGVACNRDGEIVGLHLTDDARENGDTWLAAEVVKVARLAHMRSRVGLRAEMEFKGARPYTIDSFDLPTEADYMAAEIAEFGSNN